MEEPPLSRLTRAGGRKFAFTTGAAFLACGGLAWYRGHPGGASALGGIGVALIVSGLMVPTRLGSIRRVWMNVAAVFSRITTPIFMGIVYFGVFAPVSLIIRLHGRNILAHRAGKDGYWIRRKADEDQIRSLEHQF
jgi:hypothetical protein